MTIELAPLEEQDETDDQPNERGIKDFGFWDRGTVIVHRSRFVPICKGCGSLKPPAVSEHDLYCDACNDQRSL